MQCNNYQFCGCSVEIISEEPILTEAEFSTFLSDFQTADYSIKIIRTASLPEKCGKEIFSSERRQIFDDGNIKTYSSYYNVHLNKYVNFACKVDNSELYIDYPGEIRETTVFEALDLPSMLLEKGIGILHASFIEYEGKAILFVGEKQVGKSTQAALWEKYKDAEIINGDRAGIYFENGKFIADGVPFCGTSKICKNKKLPIVALICLSQGNNNVLRRLSTLDAFMNILGKFSYTVTADYADKAISIAENIAKHLPVYAYSCLNHKSAVDVLYNELKDNLR